MDAQMNASARAERIVADQEDAAKKDLEEPLMRTVTRGPDGLSVAEVLQLVRQPPELTQKAARTIRSILRGGEVVVLKSGMSQVR